MRLVGFGGATGEAVVRTVGLTDVGSVKAKVGALSSW